VNLGDFFLHTVGEPIGHFLGNTGHAKNLKKILLALPASRWPTDGGPAKAVEGLGVRLLPRQICEKERICYVVSAADARFFA
jgi:hypothetical protein